VALPLETTFFIPMSINCYVIEVNMSLYVLNRSLAGMSLTTMSFMLLMKFSITKYVMNKSFFFSLHLNQIKIETEAQDLGDKLAWEVFPLLS